MGIFGVFATTGLVAGAVVGVMSYVGVSNAASQVIATAKEDFIKQKVQEELDKKAGK